MSFEPVAAPPVGSRGGEPAMSLEDAEQLVEMIRANGWVQDSDTYAEAKDAYRAAAQYRRAVESHNINTDGLILGCRVRPVEGGNGLFLTLRPKQEREPAKAPATGKGGKKS